MLTIQLKRGEEKRLLSGHPWIFSNEIAAISGERSPGVTARLMDASGRLLGVGYYNPHSLIAFRLLSPMDESIDSVDFFRSRISSANAYRHKLLPGLTTYRVVFGESDFLPGLVVDRYGDYLSIQLLTQGVERRQQFIVDALVELFHPKGIIARNDVGVRGLEGLPEEVNILHGEIPDLIEIEEHGLRLVVDLLKGQKTGHFIDQRENHLLLQPISRDKEVLDCFSYSGSWGLHAASFGASRVTCLDISERAVELVRQQSRMNGLEAVVTAERIDVFDRLRSLKSEGRRFDVIVLDPPAFVKSKKLLAEAIRGYTTINRRAMELLNPEGYLITCSCSFHMQREEFRTLLASAARQAGKTMRLVTSRGQAADHPVLLSVPETDYLKCVVLQAI
ncbi:MAG TPA: class I SAM-dependent rRNA methyltransferase [Geobacterales bacterium]|nr:class I SAM-dependent rRNA methyltransferase [Geobacterales bacterium]